MSTDPKFPSCRPGHQVRLSSHAPPSLRAVGEAIQRRCARKDRGVSNYEKILLIGMQNASFDA